MTESARRMPQLVDLGKLLCLIASFVIAIDGKPFSPKVVFVDAVFVLGVIFIVASSGPMMRNLAIGFWIEVQNAIFSGISRFLDLLAHALTNARSRIFRASKSMKRRIRKYPDI